MPANDETGHGRANITDIPAVFLMAWFMLYKKNGRSPGYAGEASEVSHFQTFKRSVKSSPCLSRGHVTV